MRSLMLLLVLAACDKGPTSEAATATATTAPQAKTSTFGAGVTLSETVAVDKILAEPMAFQGKTVRVEGLVVDVCPRRGCWFEMAGDAPGNKLKFKVTDGEMVFPVESKGMYATAQGKVFVNELSLEDSKQYAEYQAKEYGKPYDPASVTKPIQVVRLDGTGAVFRAKK